MKLHHFHCDFLHENFYLSQVNDLDSLLSQIHKQLKIVIAIPEDAQVPLGCCFVIPTKGICIWIPEKNDVKTISKLEILVHEANHATTNVLKFRGIEDDETRSYLIQYIFRNCYKLLKGK
jgi:hypothetical protein